MGALPSRETHQRGLYSHRHGRNRRSEIILIPLTSDFFPSHDCPLFAHVYRARYRRTAKYYYRALRSADAAPESDYFCVSSKLSEPDEFAEFDSERQRQQHQMNKKSDATSTSDNTTITAQQQQQQHRPSDYAYQSYTDTPAGLYQVLVKENDLCLYDTDAQLREAYQRQVEEQRGAWDLAARRFRSNPANPASDPREVNTTNTTTNTNSTNSSGGGGTNINGLSAGFENVPFDAFLSGYAAAKQYLKGRRRHTHANTDVPDGNSDNTDGNHTTPTRVCPCAANTAAATANNSSTNRKTPSTVRHCKHVTSPAAYHIHPIPCVIASRWDVNKPPPVDDPLYVMFEGFHVKIMGMFGVFPSTTTMRTEPDGSCGGGGEGGERRPFPRKEGNPGAPESSSSSGSDDDDGDDYDDADDGGGGGGGGGVCECKDPNCNCCNNTRRRKGAHRHHRRRPRPDGVEHHMLKGTMFVDKDVGDQILGNMVMLATHAYVRQCVRAQIQPRHIPMQPFFMRFPMSNIPMLQFLREFRVRLRTLLEAGTAKSGQKPVHVGMTGFNPMDVAEVHSQARAKIEEGMYLFEEDIPNVCNDSCGDAASKLFLSPAEASAVTFTSHKAAVNTNESGRIPIFMLSGFNVQNTPLRHPLLNDTGLGPKPPPPPAMPFPNSTTSINTTSSGGVGGLPPAQCPTVTTECRKAALLHRRKNRFRLWLEDGHVCLWASAAYARRACLILAQQLNTTVDSHSVPEQRSWMLRGLLHTGRSSNSNSNAYSSSSPSASTSIVVPAPATVNDVMVVAEDCPAASLWQGDVLRCCTTGEHAAMAAGLPLPLPCRTSDSNNGNSAADGGGGSGGGSNAASSIHGPGSPTSPTAGGSGGGGGTPFSTAMPTTANNSSDSPTKSTGPSTAATAAHYTSNHPRNPLLQEQAPAPPGAFWVRACGGLDDSYTNVSESNMPPNPKMLKQLQQAVQQRAKKLAAAAIALSRLHNNTALSAALGLTIPSITTTAANDSSSGCGGKQQRGGGGGGAYTQQLSLADRLATDAAAASLALSMASDFLEVDRREGTLNLEEVVLAWVRYVSIASRESSSSEAEGDWVRDPSGDPVRIDRFVFRRIDFEGVRFFVGVTPRFVGQQRRIEKVLGEVYAMERRANSDSCDDNDGTPTLNALTTTTMHIMKGRQNSGSSMGGGGGNNASGGSHHADSIGSGAPSSFSASAIAAAAAAAATSSTDDVGSGGGDHAAMLRALGGNGNDNDGEGHEDVLERMGFGPHRLREALERSEAAKSGGAPTATTTTTATTIAATTSSGSDGGGGCGVDALLAAAAAAAAADDDDHDHDLLGRFERDQYRLTED